MDREPSAQLVQERISPAEQAAFNQARVGYFSAEAKARHLDHQLRYGLKQEDRQAASDAGNAAWEAWGALRKTVVEQIRSGFQKITTLEELKAFVEPTDVDQFSAARNFPRDLGNERFEIPDANLEKMMRGLTSVKAVAECINFLYSRGIHNRTNAYPAAVRRLSEIVRTVVGGLGTKTEVYDAEDACEGILKNVRLFGNEAGAGMSHAVKEIFRGRMRELALPAAQAAKTLDEVKQASFECPWTAAYERYPAIDIIREKWTADIESRLAASPSAAELKRIYRDCPDNRTRGWEQYTRSGFEPTALERKALRAWVDKFEEEFNATPTTSGRIELLKVAPADSVFEQVYSVTPFWHGLRETITTAENTEALDLVEKFVRDIRPFDRFGSLPKFFEKRRKELSGQNIESTPA